MTQTLSNLLGDSRVFLGSILLSVLLFAGIAWVIANAKAGVIYKTLAVLLFAVSIPTSLWAFTLTLGKPIPVLLLSDLPRSGWRVIGFKVVPEDATYVLLDVAQDMPPRYYRIPWGVELNAQLDEALESRRPFSLLFIEGSFVFHADKPPVDVLPEKPVEAPLYDGELAE